MGKRKTYRQNKKRDKRPTRKRQGLKGGNIYGIIPIVSYNNVAIEPGIDKNEYIQKNRVYPEFEEPFDINSVYTNVQDFFKLKNENNAPLKTRKIKIALHTDKDLREINVLNKMIRAVNKSINPILRQDKNKTNLDVLRSFDNGKIYFNALYGLTLKERIIGENLITSGLFDKTLYYSPHAKETVTNDDIVPDYLIQNEQLKKINNDLNFKLGQPIQFPEVLKTIADVEADRLAKEEAERFAKEEAERLAKKEAERLAKEKAELEEKKKQVFVKDDRVTYTHDTSPDFGKKGTVTHVDLNNNPPLYSITFEDNNKIETIAQHLTKNN